mmetsp:Transcript_17691/g.21212  ORF Transcript_17691/g.21212 Transcript_17691/m.21212 type:complete len:191 (+) Transcript_17691:164-736(+)|eukprot:CAMPEP_0197853962 /NCGR_PEP_ID=MMETSP1438-20131217/23789_1 /TAXON_ID=1461541 /ORGANISM="Pterosperma sp., Strain CCMP1384" /LENGTH=190 /DNA_ID=CAMNT_0043468555 /DNA_START=157 /DNA_END=729 /DNA_ORIENTATION=+
MSSLSSVVRSGSVQVSPRGRVTGHADRAFVAVPSYCQPPTQSCVLRGSTRTPTACSRPANFCRGSFHNTITAKQGSNNDDTSNGNMVLSVGSQYLSTVASVIPESVPRPLAKVIAGVVSLVLVTWCLKAVFNVFFSLAALAAAAVVGWKVMNRGSTEDEEAAAKKDQDVQVDDDDDVSLAEARRIMDKYK